jgi:hypothetical protein
MAKLDGDLLPMAQSSLIQNERQQITLYGANVVVNQAAETRRSFANAERSPSCYFHPMVWSMIIMADHR